MLHSIHMRLLPVIINRRTLPPTYTKFIRTISVKCTKLIAEEYGDPLEVVHEITEDFGEPEGSQVLVKMLAAPVNPADINTIQGVYAVKPPLPMVLGNEGVGEVMFVGDDVDNLKTGDRVIPRGNAMGTWSSHLLTEADNFIKIPSNIPVIDAATIAVNPCTAYRMLKDYVVLNAGDTMIQNGANSAVGQAAIQIAAAMGVYTINVIRDRPNVSDLKEYLTNLGGTVVVTEKELRKSNVVKSMPKPRLALNCTSGSVGTEILRQLETGGVMVTYGGMSRQPVKVPVGSLIFTDVCLKGFWMTRWNNEHYNDVKRHRMLENLFTFINQGSLKPPVHNLLPFNQYKTALENAMPFAGMVGCKQILLIDD